MLKGNKGEWSELYVLVKLLSDGLLFQSDINLNKNHNNYYEVIKAYKDDQFLLVFERNETIKLYSIKNNERTFIKEFTLDYIHSVTKKLYKGIINASGKSFNLPPLNDFIQEAQITKIKASNTSKSDIKLRIYDHRLAKEADLGFSIKSLLGGDSTLFNTGLGNNFIYNINSEQKINVPEFNQASYKPDGKISKLTLRLQTLIERYSADIHFKEIQSRKLWLNLKMIDGDLPEILSYSLLYRWLDRKSTLAEVTELLEERDPLNFYDGNHSEQKFYEYKLKKFLVECAMGMTSESIWQGIYDATGGVIICKNDGDIVCFHIYDFNLFRDYLLNNTKFEQPSTGEDENNPGTPRLAKNSKKYHYGWLYEENKEYLFKINLQIRFI